MYLTIYSSNSLCKSSPLCKSWFCRVKMGDILSGKKQEMSRTKCKACKGKLCFFAASLGEWHMFGGPSGGNLKP